MLFCTKALQKFGQGSSMRTGHQQVWALVPESRPLGARVALESRSPFPSLSFPVYKIVLMVEPWITEQINHKNDAEMLCHTDDKHVIDFIALYSV